MIMPSLAQELKELRWIHKVQIWEVKPNQHLTTTLEMEKRGGD